MNEVRYNLFLSFQFLNIIHVIASGGKTSPTTSKSDGEDENDNEEKFDKKNEDDMMDEDDDEEAEDEDNEDDEDADEIEVRRSDRACRLQDAAKKKAATSGRFCERSSSRRTSPRKQR